MRLTGLGADPTGWTVPGQLIDDTWRCHCVRGDVSFDLALIERYGATVRSIEPVAEYVEEARGGRPGIRSGQRDPRDRRRPRNRRPRRRLLGTRQLRHATAFVDGFVPAITIGTIAVAIGAAAALLIPPLRRTTAATLKPAVEAAA